MIALAVSALAVLAQADTVLLIRSPDEAWRPFEQRLTAELQASGFEVRALDVTVDPAKNIRAQLEGPCRDEGAVAALWFNPRPDGTVDAWVADQVTSKAVLRTYEQPKDGIERARLALRAVELLHASLLEVRLVEQREFPELPVKRRFAPRVEKPHWTFGTGVGLAITPNLRPQPLLELRLGYAFSPAWTTEVHAISSVFPTRVEGKGYGADVGVAMVRALAQFTPVRGQVLTLGVAAGTGALLLWATGDTMLSGLDVRTEARVTWLLSGGPVVSARVNEGIRLQLLSLVGVTLPEIGVQLAGIPRASIGRPIIDLLIRLEFE